MNPTGIKLLLVEDDEALRFIIKDNLEQKNYTVDVAEDGMQALNSFNKEKYTLIILDIMLPKKDGFEVAKEIRKKDEDIPIIFLTARSMTEDKITGLTLGGDDYITKPFSMEELFLKIKIFIKRSNVDKQNLINEPLENIEIGSYNFFPDELLLKQNEKSRKLTLKEAELIRLFAFNKNKVLNRDRILTEIWGSNDYFLGRSLDVFISRLRKYFSEDPNIKILNIHGIGFRFSVNSTH